MNVEAIIKKGRRLTNTSEGNFLTGVSADVLADLNIEYGKRILDILKVQVDRNASQEEAITNLISVNGLTPGDNGYNGEYAFPTDLLRPVRVEISYDGELWTKATVYDVTDNNASEAHDVNSYFDQAKPYVRFDRDSYFIRPLNAGENVDGGIHIWYEQRQEDLTSDSPVFESNLHDMLAFDLASLEYLMHSDRYSPNWKRAFDDERIKTEFRFLDFYKNRFKRNFRLNSVRDLYE